MNLRILILTQYFPPEVGAPQNRLFELAIRLQKKGADISILTASVLYLMTSDSKRESWKVGG